VHTTTMKQQRPCLV